MAQQPKGRIHATLVQHQRLERITVRAGLLNLVGLPRVSRDGTRSFVLLRGLDFAMDKAEAALDELDGGEQQDVTEVSF